ncbi:MAG: hypothetical protein ACR65R_17325, partial [Methylomicrobium sp.]
DQFNVVVARTVMELNGISCLDLEEMAPDKQQIVCSRSFSRRLTEYRELAEALAEFCSRAAEKLRYQNSVAGHLSVFIRTNPFNPNEPQYQRAAGINLVFSDAGYPRDRRYGEPSAQGAVQGRLPLPKVRRATEPDTAGIYSRSDGFVRVSGF